MFQSGTEIESLFAVHIPRFALVWFLVHEYFGAEWRYGVCSEVELVSYHPFIS
jgi:hypothetical protein